MPASERSRELIQKYLDELASEAELIELEALLAVDPDVADAFAQAARLQTCLKVHFQKQYKIDQVARLLAEEKPLSAAVEHSGAGKPVVVTVSPDVSAGSTFVPGRGQPREPRRTRSGSRFPRLRGLVSRKSWIAAAVLLLATGSAIWISVPRGAVDLPRVLSGRVMISGREVAMIPLSAWFDVSGRQSAMIELPGGSRMELDGGTQAGIRGDARLTVVELVTGGGQFNVPPERGAVEVETPLGRVTSTGSDFSVILTTAASVQFTATKPMPAPQLSIIVARGSVTIERGGVMTTLSAGDERIFF